MHWRLEALKAGFTGRLETMEQFFSSRRMSPPDRNTAEFLQAYARSPRLSPVTKIATDLSCVEGKLYRIKPGGEKDEIKDHPFLDFLSRPNPLPHITRSALWKLIEIHLLIKGEGAAIIERDAAGYPYELWPIPPHWVMDIPRLNYPYFLIHSRDGLQKEIPAADMFLMRQLNPHDPYDRGLGDAEPVADEIETDEYMAKWAKKFFYNDATPPVVMSAPGITKDEYDRFQVAWNERHRGVGNAHKMGIIPRDVKLQKLVDSQREMDFTESRKNLRDGVNAHFGVPPEILGIVENSNRATATQAKIIYAENVLTPRLLARQNAINEQLLTMWGDDLLYEYDDIIPEDMDYKLQMSNEGISRSALLIDEWREINGLEELENKKGKVLLVPISSIPTPPDELTQSVRQDENITPSPTVPAAGEAPPAPPAGDTLGQNDDPATEQLAVASEIALSGAQITSLVQIARSVALGELDRMAAIEIITAAFPFDREKAEQIIGNTESPPADEPLPGVKSDKKANNLRRLQAAHRNNMRKLSAMERAAKPKLKHFLADQTKQILAAITPKTKAADDNFWSKIIPGAGLAVDIAAIRDNALEAIEQLIDWSAQDQELSGLLSPIWQEAFETGSKSALEIIGANAIEKPSMTDYLREHGLSRVQEINNTTREKLAASIATGVEAGEGIGELISRIKEHMPDIEDERARTIATCEVHTSMQAGSFAQMKYAGIKTKTWVDAGDDDVRESHVMVNGETVGINERFSNGLLYPGDPAGSAAEIINCRCDLLPGDFGGD